MPAPTPLPKILGPGSAAHHSANAPCCAAHGTRYRHDFAFSRRDFARVMQILMSSPSKQRAQGMPGARCTRGLVCLKCEKRRTRAYRAAEAVRHPLRNGFTAYFVLSPVSGLFCHRHFAKNSAKLDASIAAPGPHDFAVRLGVSSGVKKRLTPKRPPHPAPHVS